MAASCVAGSSGTAAGPASVPSSRSGACSTPGRRSEPRADRVGLGIGGGELLQPLRCPVAGEQAHLPAHQCRGERHQEVVAVAAQVEGIAAVGQALAVSRHVAQESRSP